MENNRKACEGFTLIEVLIAMIILTVGLLAMMVMQSRAITTNHSASNITRASSAAAGQIERLQRMSYTDSELTGGSHSLLPAPGFAPGTDFPVTWVVTDNSPVLGCKRIALSVQVPNNGQTVTLEYVKHRDL